MPDFSNERERVRYVPVPETNRQMAHHLRAVDDAVVKEATRSRIQSAVAAERLAQRNLLIGRQFPARK